jgi:hypothetical protein
MITVRDVLNDLNGFVEQNPEYAKLPVVYSHDDEGNAYQKVICSPALLQVEDINERYLEIPMEQDKPNCVIIN